ncbi:hypothetical protein L484_018996 [Morus notabilis]|uniref:Bifunctional inhibitor/plant lipid transfer protein/seed storage helical domain-containing protein n=1 Tax=Morus notabilis TaxID=981085 RepID=W9RGG5_9ROSA|nr:lipid transfer-like protein VAS [Morus notabilis]EXB54438.1 hypothetical protein L484_018996 [Morus notabilis]
MGYLKTTAMAVIAVAMVLAMTAKAQTQTCISKLAQCADSLNKTKPDQSCCTAIKDAVTTEFPCLCNVFNTPGLLTGFGVTVDEALNLTKACDVPINLSQCNSTSPSPSPVPGGDNHNGAETTAWTGVSTLCVFFVSILFY